jgi:hypothetical protein
MAVGVAVFTIHAAPGMACNGHVGVAALRA